MSYENKPFDNREDWRGAKSFAAPAEVPAKDRNVPAELKRQQEAIEELSYAVESLTQAISMITSNDVAPEDNKENKAQPISDRMSNMALEIMAKTEQLYLIRDRITSLILRIDI